MKYLLLITLIFFIYIVIIEPNILTVRHIQLRDENLKGLRIVFASDFHFKPFEIYRLKRIVKRINNQNPDIILFGGDYVNGHKKGSTLDLNTMAAEFSGLKSKYGTVAVIGNHDGWQGRYEITETLKSADITVLDNGSKEFDKFFIAGLEDLQTGSPDVEKALYNTHKTFADGSRKPVILLTHTPDMISEIPSDVNLTLAGHTHGGQVVLPFKGPLIVPSKYGKKYAYGLFDVDGKKMFVSKGLGTSILPVRFNCVPEIVVIEFD